VPRHTPADVIGTLNREVNAGLADPKLKAQLADQGGIEMPGTPADFGKLIADETEKWAKVIRTANIKLSRWRRRGCLTRRGGFETRFETRPTDLSICANPWP
jgi:hypothetical protein